MSIATPYLMTKLKNKICKRIPKEDLHFALRNININGEKRGCSGFVTYLPTGRCVYVDTEPSVLACKENMMYRYARDEKDYSSSHADFDASNVWTTADALASDIATALTKPRESIRTIRIDKIGYR